MSVKWWACVIITELTVQFFNGLSGCYSVVKDDIQQQFHITQSYYGIVEMVSMFVRILGSLQLILLPTRGIKNGYLLYVMLLVGSCLVIMSMHYFPEYAKILLFIGMFGFGIGRACSPLPYLLAEQYMNTEEFVTALNIWFGLNIFGNAFAYVLQYLTSTVLEIHWTVYFLIFTGVYLLTGILTYVIVDQIQVVRNEDQTVGQQMGEILSSIKDYYQRKRSNLILLFDFCFQENTIMIVKFWLPLYLVQMGFVTTSNFIMLAFPIFYCLGGFLLNLLLSKFTNQIPIFTIVFLFLSLISFSGLLLLTNDISQFILYFLCVGFGFFFLSSPYSKAATNQFGQRTISRRQKYIILNFMRLSRQVVSSIFMVVIGFVMEIKYIYFIVAVSVNAVLAIIFHITRRIVQNKQNQQKQLQQQGSQSS